MKIISHMIRRVILYRVENGDMDERINMTTASVCMVFICSMTPIFFHFGSEGCRVFVAQREVFEKREVYFCTSTLWTHKTSFMDKHKYTLLTHQKFQAAWLVLID